MTAPVGAVVIGRNEGERLIWCLASLTGTVDAIVYVDSGSTDGSAEAAWRAGAEVVLLDEDQPFTAARARNAGLDRLCARDRSPDFVQFVDGDCVVRPGWVARAAAFLRDHSDVAVVCGRRRERDPDASIYNRLIDAEWNTPVGETRACGGDSMMRMHALAEVGGFDPALIAGEEPELCIRLRKAGWRVWRLDAEMTLHDAAMTRFAQWWMRSRRAGHAYAEGAALHGARPERHYVPELRRALTWGLAMPIAIVAGLAATSWAAMLLAAWPAQVVRLILRGAPLSEALFLTLAKFPEALGALDYAAAWATGRRRSLIEYK